MLSNQMLYDLIGTENSFFTDTFSHGIIWIYRILIWIAITIKWLIEIHRWYFWYKDQDSFFYYHKKAKWFSWVLIELFSYWSYVKIIWGILLSLWLFYNLTCGMLAFFLMIEFLLFFKHHTSLLFIVVLIFLFDSSFNSHYSLSSISSNINWSWVSEWKFLIKYFIILIYFSSGFRKLQSKSFMNWLILKETIDYFKYNLEQRLYKDFFLNYFKTLSKLNIDYAKVAKTTIYMQFIVGLFLLSWNNYLTIVWISLWIIMHIVMTVFYSYTLIAFSILIISSYILFLR